MSEEKILQEEILSDDELEQVAGGSYSNTAADTRILNQLGFDIKAINEKNLETYENFAAAADEVTKIFKIYGITVEQNYIASNIYYKSGEQISRYAAFKTIADSSGKEMPDISY